MARLARVVVPGMLHDITQRGNRRQQTFFQEDDYALYLDLMAQSGASETDLALIRRHERTGRPLGDDGFLKRLEKRLGLVLRRLKPGPKPPQKRN